ncbi:MAG: serine/threonine-protein kinase [Firmicutes bacterium]|nr:serine/threonine-protein kinase [Bacillota bacterium]
MEGQTIIANGEKYEIIKLIAKGKGGYTYLAKTRDTAVAVKQIHYEPCDYFQFEENKLNSELRDYKTLCDLGIPMPKLLFSSQEGQFLIKEYIPGGTLAQIAADHQVNTNHIIQIFEMCEKLYSNHVNIDYFPTNFMERQGVLYYVDYECSNYSDEWNFENWGIWFLANQKGMASFVKNGDHSSLLENGKPVQKGLEDIVKRWLLLKEHRAV